MYKSLENIGISFNSEQIKLFDKYIKSFKNYNECVNLISTNDVNFLYEKHIYDSLSLNLFFIKHQINDSIKLLDIGTGGGFPSVPLALTYNKFNVYALDSIQKKLRFIDNLKNALKLTNLNTICSRVEELDDKYRNSFDIVTTRAMAELRVILEYAIPFVKVGGYFIAYKSLKASEEIENAQNAIKQLNVKLIDKIEYSLPIDNDNTRVLLIFKKEKNTNSLYPRKNGVIKKNPL